MSGADVAILVLWLALTAYAVLAGADFGAGILDLLAGGPREGARPRALIDASITPVWEANHTWLIFALVILWTAFPVAFAGIMRTLFVPLALAAAGIVVRGSAFAFRKVIDRLAGKQLFGAGFALASLATPFFLGTTLGSIASGRVPPNGGDLLGSWIAPTPLMTGVLAVVACAHLAAVFLVADARRRGDVELEAYFRRRALVTAVVAGGLALVGLAVLDLDASGLFDGLMTRALPLVGASVVAGGLTIALLARGFAQLLRPFVVIAVAAIIVGWGVAQFPLILPPDLTIDQAASPPGTLDALAVVAVAALLIVGPSLAALFVLDQRRGLETPGPWR